MLRISPASPGPPELLRASAAALRVHPRDASLFRVARFCNPPASLIFTGEALYVRLVRGGISPAPGGSIDGCVLDARCALGLVPGS